MNNQEIVYVDPKDIFIPDERIDAFMESDQYEIFSESIRTRGVIQPIRCHKVDGRYIVVDGKHRTLEAIRHKLPTVPVVFTEGSEEDVLMDNLATNDLKGDPRTVDKVLVIRMLIREYNVDPDELQRKTGFSKDYTNKLLRIAEGPQEVIDALDQRRITVEVAYQLNRFEDPIVLIKVLNQIVQFNWSTKRALEQIRLVREELAKPLEEQRPIEAIEPSLPICHGCGDEYEPHRGATLNVCGMCDKLARQFFAQYYAEQSAPVGS